MTIEREEMNPQITQISQTHEKRSSFCLLTSVFCLPLLLRLPLLLGASNAAQNPASKDAAAPAAQSAAPPAPAVLPVVIDPKVQPFLDRCIQALGGDAFLTSKNLTTRGRVYSIQDERTAGMAPFESWFQYPDKRRFSYGKDKPVIIINDGDRGWHLDQFGQFELSKQQIQNWQLVTRYSLENVLRLRIHEPGALVQDGGVDFVDNLPAHVLEVFDAQHTHLKLYLNTKTFRPIRISYRIRNPQTQDFDEYSDVYSDYLPYEGIQTAMHMARFVNDERVSETFRTFAHYNDAYPAETFRPVAMK
jgi:outer membrane lipoprotein-sorting protein